MTKTIQNREMTFVESNNGGKKGSFERGTQLLQLVLEQLESAGVQYCIARNYEGYPDVITGDVDIIVSAEKLNKAVRITNKIAINNRWKPYIIYTTHQAAHLGFFTNINSDRFVLVIEFMIGGIWRSFFYLNGNSVIKKRIKHGNNIWKPHPAHELTITLVHHLLYNSCVYDKYRARINRLFEESRSEIINILGDAFGIRIAKRIFYFLDRKDWEKIEGLSKRMRIFLVANRLFNNPLNIISLIKLNLEIRDKPRGMAIFISGGYSQSDVARELISIAKKWHIFIPPFKKIIFVNTNNYKYSKKVINYGIKSGGVVVVICENEYIIKLLQNENNTFSDVTIGVNNTSYELKTYGENHIVPITKLEQDSHDIWKRILNSFSFSNSNHSGN